VEWLGKESAFPSQNTLDKVTKSRCASDSQLIQGRTARVIDVDIPNATTICNIGYVARRSGCHPFSKTGKKRPHDPCANEVAAD